MFSGAGKAHPHLRLQSQAEGAPGGVRLVKHVTRDGVQALLRTPHKASGQQAVSRSPGDLEPWDRGHSSRARPGLNSSHGRRAGSRLPPHTVWVPGSAPCTAVGCPGDTGPPHTGAAQRAGPPAAASCPRSLRSPQIHYITPWPQPSCEQLRLLPGMGWGLSLLLGTEEGLSSVQQKDLLLTSTGRWGLDGGGSRLRSRGERRSTQTHGARGTRKAFTVSGAEDGSGLHHPRPTPW